VTKLQAESRRNMERFPVKTRDVSVQQSVQSGKQAYQPPTQSVP